MWVHVEARGLVLANRYRRMPNPTIPLDQTTDAPLVDSIMGNRVTGSKVVFARTTIQANRAGPRRMRFGYSDGAVVYRNGQPLFFGMNASRLRSPDLALSALDRVGKRPQRVAVCGDRVHGRVGILGATGAVGFFSP